MVCERRGSAVVLATWAEWELASLMSREANVSRPRYVHETQQELGGHMQVAPADF